MNALPFDVPDDPKSVTDEVYKPTKTKKYVIPSEQREPRNLKKQPPQAPNDALGFPLR